MNIDPRAAERALMTIVFLVGAIGGAVAFRRWGQPDLLVPVALCVVGLVVSAWQSWRAA